MGALQALRSLDRRVLPVEKQKSPDAWLNMASRWWVLLVAAGAYVTTTLVVVALMDSAAARVMALAGLLPPTVFFGYAAGQQKAEHDRLMGRDPLAKRRPTSL